MKVIKANGIKIHYRIDGPEDGFPVLFSNALGTDFRIWDAMLPHLPDGLRILRYDTRGHGLSDAPQAPYYMGDLVQDAAALLEALDVKGALMVGLSIGGMIAQGLAAERPDLLRAVVLMDTATKIGNERIWQERVGMARKGGIEVLEETTLTRWFTKEFHANEQNTLAGIRAMLTRTPLEGYIGCCEAIAETDLYASTAHLSLPTLAIVGAEDGSTPPDMVAEMASLIKGSRFEVIRKAGHLPCVEQPEKTAALIADFMQENGFG